MPLAPGQGPRTAANLLASNTVGGILRWKDDGDFDGLMIDASERASAAVRAR